MKALQYMILFLAFSLPGASLLLADHFIDDFDRADGPVGNGWDEVNDGGLDIRIGDNQLMIGGTQAGDWAANSITRDITGLGEFKSVYARTKSIVLHPELSISNANTNAYLTVSGGHGWHFVYTISPDGGWNGWNDPPNKFILGEDWVEFGIIQTAPGIFRITIDGQTSVEGLESMDEVTNIKLNTTVEAGQTDTMYAEYVEINREDISAATSSAGKLATSWGEVKLDY